MGEKRSSECHPELVSAFLDAELNGKLMRLVTKHLLTCESCCRLLSDLARARDALRGRCTLPDPEGLTGSVMAALNDEPPITPPPSFLRRRLARFAPLSVAAALAAAPQTGLSQEEANDERRNGTEQHANISDRPDETPPQDL
ncbi:MAG: zf-HC2 domain-containing protein [Magnetococcales bacterium]|nr:zf-HC2 domain-containing protein [Magnetococcales bacterium]